MYKFSIALGIAFVAGFSLAMLLITSDAFSPETKVTTIPAENISQENIEVSHYNNAQVFTVKESRMDKVEEPGTREEEQIKLKTEENLDSVEILLKYPPPHVADANFFNGPDVNDLELTKLRRQALDEQLLSMQEAGIEDEDIQASIGAYELEIEDTVSSNNNQQPVLSQQQVDSNFSQGMLEAGESNENIQQMLKDMKTNNEMDNQDQEGIIDDVTGLNHQAPPLPENN